MNLLQRFTQELKKLASTDASFLLTVSGGLDSCVMTALFHEAKFKCSIAHCNFQLRGTDSQEDEAFVQRLGNLLGHVVYITSFETSRYAEEHQLSIQMAARELRYKWFKELKEAHHINYIVTAHHAGDQSETMLLNLVKGRSAYSLQGIPALNNSIIRPLLSFTKEELHQYAVENDIKWREDASNATSDYERNYIRNKVIPLLKEINPSLDAAMKNNSMLLNESSDFIKQSFKSWKVSACIVEQLVITVADVKALQQHPLCNNFLFLLLQEYNFTTPVIRQVTENLDAGSGKVFFSSTHQLAFDRNSFSVHPVKQKNSRSYTISNKGITENETCIVSIEDAEMADFNAGSFTAFFDAGELTFPLTIRHWKEGDTFMPLGMEHHKKLSDFFIDNKVPLTAKNDVWLLVSEGEIAWVVGYRIDQRFALTDSTKTILKITFAVP